MYNLTLDFSDGSVAGLKCSLSFHPQWGIALDVTDADTSIALGELELRKQAILERLKMLQNILLQFLQSYGDTLKEPGTTLKLPGISICNGKKHGSTMLS